MAQEKDAVVALNKNGDKLQLKIFKMPEIPLIQTGECEYALGAFIKSDRGAAAAQRATLSPRQPRHSLATGNRHHRRSPASTYIHPHPATSIRVHRRPAAIARDH